MNKKIYVPLVLALVAALAFAGVAFAKSGLPKGEVRRVGEVISVDMATNTFKFDTNTGVRYTFHVTSGTTYLGLSGLSALKADNRLNLQVKKIDGVWTVEQAKLLPDMNETEARENMRDHGVVIAITTSSFTIRNGEGKVFTFQVINKTRFSGRDVPHFRELKLGMHVTVNFRLSGTLMDARQVLVTGR